MSSTKLHKLTEMLHGVSASLILLTAVGCVQNYEKMNRDWNTFCSQPGHLNEYDVKNIQDTTEGNLYGSAPYLLKNIQRFERFSGYDFRNDWDQLEHLERDCSEWNTKASLSLQYAEARKNPYMIAYANKASNLLPKLERQILLCKQILQPYRDAYNRDEERKTTTCNTFKQHILQVAESEGLQSSSLMANDDCLLHIERLEPTQDSLKVYIRQVLFPYRAAKLNKIMAYTSGSSLGTATLNERLFLGDTLEAKCAQSGLTIPFRRGSDPQETISVFVFKTDKPLTTGEEIRFVLRGENINFDCTAKIGELIPETNTYTPSLVAIEKTPGLTSGLHILECQKLGSHLEVPCKISVGEKSVTLSLLLDTGASRTTIPLSTYRQISSKNTQLLKTIRLSTANGVIQTPLDEIDVSTSAYSLPLEVSILNDDVALLGMDYFANRLFTIDVPNKCIYVQKLSSETSLIKSLKYH